MKQRHLQRIWAALRARRRFFLATLRVAAVLMYFGLCGAVMTATAAYLYLAPLLPSASTYRDVQLEIPLRIYTADGALIDEIGNRRDPVSYSEIPQVLVDALIATEDSRFHSHMGVDLQSLLRGFYGFVTGDSLGGGSTIAMQLANNLSFDSDNVYLRKLKEIPFAIQIHRELSREEILELYLNLIYFGSGADGIGAASFVYYGKQPSELTLAEAAMMVSVLPCPSSCNPLTAPERAVVRREVRLRNMLDQGMITRADYAQANNAPVTARRRGRNIEVPAPYVAEMVRQRVYQQHGEDTYSGGFEVTTSILGNLQQAANHALVNGLERHYDRRHGYRGPATSFPPQDDRMANWLENLRGIPSYGNQIPAIVTEVRERSFAALLRGGESVNVPWQGMTWAAAFRSRDEAWPPPRRAGDVVAVGDLVRLTEGPTGWELGQVPDLQGTLVAVAPDDGGIMALVGGYDFGLSQVNRAVTARPPGSNFKPFVYGAALEQGYTAASLLNDAPFSRSGYRPSNYENNFLGPITLRHALQESRNVPTVRLYDQLGSEALFRFAAKFGFPVQTFPRNDLTIALGSRDVRPLDMAAAFATLANGGFKVDPWLIRDISNIADGTLFRANPRRVCVDDCATGQETAAEGATLPPAVAPRVVDPRVVFILNSLLRSVVEEGSGSRVQRELGRGDLMGKTGTTNGPQELWFSGFNRDIAATVFVGFDQPEPMGEREQGATVALPIWIDFMREALRGQPERTMARPDGIVDRLIDKATGKLALPGDSNTRFEYFRVENDPVDNASGSRGAEATGADDEEVTTETIF